MYSHFHAVICVLIHTFTCELIYFFDHENNIHSVLHLITLVLLGSTIRMQKCCTYEYAFPAFLSLAAYIAESLFEFRLPALFLIISLNTTQIQSGQNCWHCSCKAWQPGPPIFPHECTCLSLFSIHLIQWKCCYLTVLFRVWVGCMYDCMKRLCQQPCLSLFISCSRVYMLQVHSSDAQQSGGALSHSPTCPLTCSL